MAGGKGVIVQDGETPILVRRRDSLLRAKTLRQIPGQRGGKVL